MFRRIIIFIFVFFGLCFCGNGVFALTENISGMSVTYSEKVDNRDSRLTLLKKFLFSPMIPYSFSDFSLLIDVDQYEPRGKVQGKKMILSPHVKTDTEFLKLFVHEVGHFVDIYLLVSTSGEKDPSEDFYSISWKEPYVKKSGISLSSFVSGYAATNQYEDFAETFVWYIFHNEDFADRALRDPVMRQKYLFFARSVFPSGQFQGTDFSLGTPPNYLWDTTKAPVLLQKYLYFLGS